MIATAFRARNHGTWPGTSQREPARPRRSSPRTSSAACSNGAATTTGTVSSSTPGDYVFRLSGTGDDPVGDPLLILRDEDGDEVRRNDDCCRRRVAHRVRGHRRPQDLLPRRQRQGPLHGSAGRRVTGSRDAGWATPPATSAFPSTGWTARRSTRSPAPSGWKTRVVDVFFVPPGRCRRHLRRRPDRRVRRLERLPDPAGDGRARRLLGRLRHRLPPDRTGARQADFELLLYGKPRATADGLFQSPRDHRRRHRHLRRRPGCRLPQRLGRPPRRRPRARCAGLGADAARVRPRARARAPARRRLRLGGHARDQARMGRLDPIRPATSA